jgi:hypothetical protein
MIRVLSQDRLESAIGPSALRRIPEESAEMSTPTAKAARRLASALDKCRKTVKGLSDPALNAAAAASMALSQNDGAGYPTEYVRKRVGIVLDELEHLATIAGELDEVSKSTFIRLLRAVSGSFANPATARSVVDGVEEGVHRPEGDPPRRLTAETSIPEDLSFTGDRVLLDSDIASTPFTGAIASWLKFCLQNPPRLRRRIKSFPRPARMTPGGAPSKGAESDRFGRRPGHRR